MIKWKLKRHLVEKYQIYSVTALQKQIVKKTGIVISVAQLCKLVNRTPTMLRLSTVEIICSALDCELGEFLQIGPRVMNPEKVKKLSFKNTPKSKVAAKGFPCPNDYDV